MSPDFESVALGDVRRLVLSRVERRNALGSAIVTGLIDVLGVLDEDPSVGAILLEGSPPGFCAGSDLKEIAEMDLAAMCRHEAESATLTRRIVQIAKPVVAAVEGFAIGGGFMVAIACDIVVSATDARWALPEVSLGWVPPWGLELLAVRVGAARARRFAYGFESFDGHEAYRLGIADYMAPSGEAGAVALDIAQKLATLPRAAVASTKRFYARLVAGNAEIADVEANRLFADDCRHENAMATLERIRKTQREKNQ
jgi:enoyl-CoA hydratase/carnithine racemase